MLHEVRMAPNCSRGITVTNIWDSELALFASSRFSYIFVPIHKNASG
jgi:hypothetical protein